MTYHVRWMIRRDLHEVLAIESACFDFPWNEEAFIKVLRERNVIGMVVDSLGKYGKPKGLILGYMIYELNKRRLDIMNFAVHPDWQGQGMGRAMVEHLQHKLSRQRRNRLTVEVRESNLDGQLFFKAMGFQCVQVLRDYYETCEDDCYVMRYNIRHVAKQWLPENRIAQYYGEVAE